MGQITFINIPAKYETEKNSIHDKALSNYYSLFTFLYLPISLNTNKNHFFEEENDKLEIFLCDYIKKFKFFTYDISIDEINPNEENLLDKKVDAIICVENECIIIDKINEDIFLRVLNELKKEQISMISTDLRSQLKDINEINSNEEVNSFCNYFQSEIINNFFVRLTIRSISCFLIRRFFYPSEFFTDKSFFNFENENHSKELDTKAKIYKLLFTNSTDSISRDEMKHDLHSIKREIKAIINNGNQKQDFQESDFIKLRTIISNEKANYYLAFHIKSHHTFMMKKINFSGNNDTIFKREIDFCNNCSHRCLMHFYGFLKKEKKIIGFIYQYLSNGPLNFFYESHQNQIDDIYSIMSIIRIFQGIEYLHKNLYIYRDLKPYNILLDNDYIPYITDFDAIRHPLNDQDVNFAEMTNDLGSSLYMSPEQYEGKNISYPTDIFSFGLLAYFLLEKKDVCDRDEILKNKELSFKIASKNMQRLIESCIKLKQSERPTIKKVKTFLLKEFILRYYIEPHIKNYIINLKESDINCFIFESIIIRIGNRRLMSDLFEVLFSFKQSFFFSFVEKSKIINFVEMGGLLSSSDSDEDTEEYVNTNMNIVDYNEMLASKNNLEAILYLGNGYYNGKKVKQDYVKAREYYELAAKQNNLKAINILAMIYFYGNGVKQDYSKAKDYFLLAAKMKDPNGYYGLGILYFHGLGVIQNYSLSMLYFEKSNNSNSLFFLGFHYFQGLGVKKDYSKAKEYFELSAQKDNHNYDAFNALGILYLYGFGVEKDYTIAKELFEIGSKNNSNSMNYLGIIYILGLGVNKDYSKALNYFNLSANLENFDSLCNLGLIYLNGYGVPKDLLRAKYYLEIGSQNKNSEAMISLGDIYYNEKNYLKAKDYYELATQLSNQFAFLKLGDLYYNGNGVDQDFSKAKRYYELASYLSNSESLFKLGDIYLNGYGVQKDLKTAKYYFELSAKLNFPKALFYLAYLYSTDDVFEVDINKSIEYYQKNINIQSGIANAEFNKISKFITLYNEYYYHSCNDLGLIYIVILNDLNNAEKYIKEAGLNEYPFGQNNLGILNQFYLNKIDDAKYMYERSMKNKFALAAYNLGYLKEKDDKIEEAIPLYIKASEYEDEPLIFHNFKHYDRRLEISKTFIICYTNLKITEYFHSINDFERSREYFI